MFRSVVYTTNYNSHDQFFQFSPTHNLSHQLWTTYAFQFLTFSANQALEFRYKHRLWSWFYVHEHDILQRKNCTYISARLLYNVLVVTLYRQKTTNLGKPDKMRIYECLLRQCNRNKLIASCNRIEKSIASKHPWKS